MYLSFYLSIYLSIYLYIYLFIHLSIYLSAYLYIFNSEPWNHVKGDDAVKSKYSNNWKKLNRVLHISNPIRPALTLWFVRGGAAGMAPPFPTFISIYLSLYVSICLSDGYLSISSSDEWSAPAVKAEVFKKLQEFLVNCRVREKLYLSTSKETWA